MLTRNEKDASKAGKPADMKQQKGNKPPQARSGGQTDSATDTKPGGGGPMQGGKK